MEHHYIPKFYLRLFSTTPRKRRISIYNFDNGLHIQDVSIKDQARKTDFYMNDYIEGIISEIENEFVPIVRRIEASSQLPDINSKEYRNLVEFTMLQRLRTPSASNEAEEMFDVIEKRLIKTFRPDVTQETLDLVKIKPGNSPVTSIMGINAACKMVSDLKLTLVLNGTDTDFITSDVPVRLYNQLFEYKSIESGNTGLGARGLQVFFPITPKHLVFLFDPDVYRISSNQGIIHLDNDQDIENINKLQVINADDQLFFSENSWVHVEMLVSKYGKYRTSENTEWAYVTLPPEYPKPVRVLRRIERLCRFKISFCAMKNKYKSIMMFDGQEYLRPTARNFLTRKGSILF